MKKKPQCPTPHKRSYRDEITAKIHLGNITRYGERRPRMPVRAYRCVCMKWHLTSWSEPEAPIR